MAITATAAGGVGGTMGIGIAPGTDVMRTTTTRITADITRRTATDLRSLSLSAAVVIGVGIATGVAVTASMVDADVGSSERFRHRR